MFYLHHPEVGMSMEVNDVVHQLLQLYRFDLYSYRKPLNYVVLYARFYKTSMIWYNLLEANVNNIYLLYLNLHQIE